MSKKLELLRQFGEYGVTFEAARNTDLLKITWNPSFEAAKECIEKFLEDKIETDEFLSLGVICVMEFGCIDIEFTSYETDGSCFDSDFFCCIQGEDQEGDDGWMSYESTNLTFDPSLLESREKIEKAMFDELMKFAKKKNLTWSMRN